MRARIATVIPRTVRHGALRERATIKRPATAADGLDDRGQISGTDVVLIRNWPCEVQTLGGVELDQARQVYPTATHVVRGRYLANHDITVRHYVTWQGRTLNIGHIRDMGNRRVMLELLCAEAVEV